MSSSLYRVISRLEPIPTLFSTLQALAAYPQFIKDFFHFRSLSKRPIPNRYSDLFPQLKDKTNTHEIDAHYIYHPAWAARILAKTKPKVHVDISSKLYFSTIVSAFIPIKFFDYRPAALELSNFSTEKNDLTNLSFKSNSQYSISCMHTVEHIGLGRYGDPIDPEGDLQAMRELTRVLAPGGSLLFVTPIGKELKIMFNAHRIYTKKYILEQFSSLELKECSIIREDGVGGLITKNQEKILSSQDYCCGCFWFTKPKK